MVKKVLKLNLSDFGIIAAVVGGGFLFIELIINIIMAFAKPDTVPTLGGILLPCLAFMLCLFINVFQVPASFEFYLRFGLTRRRALEATVGLMSVETVYAFLLVWVFVQADRLVPLIWRAFRPDLGTEPFSVPLWGCALMAAAAVLLGLISGSVIQRFGRKAMWVLWVGFMGFITVMNVTDWNVFEVEFIPPAAIVLGAAMVLAAVAWSVWSLLHACVKN